MLKLIRTVEVFDPAPLGARDLLIGGGQLLAIAEPGSIDVPAEVTDGTGLIAFPGIVDALTHPCGGGGEGGFGNRTPEIPIETFALAGVTTPVGALGTDSTGRSLDVLYGNVMGLRARGLDAFMYTGAYRFPAPTLTGDIVRDLYLVEPVIGVGEIAIADHRGSQPSAMELRRLGSEVSVGGTLCGRGGTVMVHVGDGESRLAVLREAVDGSDLAASVFYPTHVNRSMALLAEAAEWAMAGGFVDITVSTTPELIAAGDISAADALRELLGAGAPPDHITMSSDAGGSLPLYENGVLKGLTAAMPSVLIELLGELRQRDEALFPVALAAMTRNPAQALRLSGIGQLQVSTNANLVLADAASGEPTHVLCRGKWLVQDGDPVIPAIGS